MRLLALTIFFLAGLVPRAFADGQKITIAQLLADPAHYRLARVQVRGQIDNCIAFTCDLCPEDMTRATFDNRRCVSLDFDDLAGDGSTGVLDDTLARAFRFATVTVDATFDPRDLLGEVIGGDKRLGLEDARVIAVHARKTARDGLIGYYDFGALRPAPKEDTAAMLQALTRDGAVPAGKQPVAVFLADASRAVANPQDVDAAGLGCICTSGDCEGRWPTRLFGGFVTPANGFSCDLLVKRHGRWWPVAWE